MPNKKACDCIILHDVESPHIVIVELKRGLVHPSEVKEKFTNTLDWLSKTKERFRGLAGYRIVLVLSHGRGISKSGNAALCEHRFKIEGKKHSLQIMSCNTQLASLYERMALRK